VSVTGILRRRNNKWNTGFLWAMKFLDGIEDAVDDKRSGCLMA
jgi:hypothetical protein